MSNPAGIGTCYWNINTWVRAFVNLKPLPPEKKWKAELGPPRRFTRAEIQKAMVDFAEYGDGIIREE